MDTDTANCNPECPPADSAEYAESSDASLKGTEEAETSDETTSSEETDACDATTGATPGVAAACRAYGFTSPDTVDLLFGIKPPGER